MIIKIKEKILPHLKRTWFKFIAIFSVTPASLFTFITLIIFIYNSFFAEASVDGKIIKYIPKKFKIISYGGTLINTSRIHANNLTLKGIFNEGNIIKFELDAIDECTNKHFNNHNRSMEFTLRRLSKKTKCNFTVLVEPIGEVTETIHASWGKNGSLSLKPEIADEETARNIEVGIDLSLRARQRRLDSNSRVITR